MAIRVIGTILIGTAAEEAAIVPEQFRALFYETDTGLIRVSNLAGNAWVDVTQFGISGNELLTANPAGTFDFTGIAGITVEDGDWIGIGAAAERIIFNAAGNAQVMGADFGIGIIPTSPFHVLGTAFPVSTLQLNAAGTGFTASAFRLFRNNTIPIANDGTGFVFSLLDSNGNITNYARIQCKATDITDGTEDGAILFDTIHNNSALTTRMIVTSNGDVGINDLTPGTTLEVVGTVTASKFTDTGGGYDFFMPNPSKPDQEMLRHWSIETDGMRTLYTGTETTDIMGKTIIELPEWFGGLAKVDSCTLTPMNNLGGLIINLETLEVTSENPLQTFCWLIVASRIDKMAQNTLASHPIVEQRDSNSRKHVKYIWNEISTGDMVKTEEPMMQ